jgi:hypothetical protein
MMYLLGSESSLEVIIDKLSTSLIGELTVWYRFKKILYN